MQPQQADLYALPFLGLLVRVLEWHTELAGASDADRAEWLPHAWIWLPAPSAARSSLSSLDQRIVRQR